MFQVRWEEGALRELEAIQRRAGDSRRQAIESAAQRIGERHEEAAATEDESRAGRQRILFEPPLIITFQVEADGRTASVPTTRQLRGRGQ